MCLCVCFSSLTVSITETEEVTDPGKRNSVNTNTETDTKSLSPDKKSIDSYTVVRLCRHICLNSLSLLGYGLYLSHPNGLHGPTVNVTIGNWSSYVAGSKSVPDDIVSS